MRTHNSDASTWQYGASFRGDTETFKMNKSVCLILVTVGRETEEMVF